MIGLSLDLIRRWRSWSLTLTSDLMLLRSTEITDLDSDSETTSKLLAIKSMLPHPVPWGPEGLSSIRESSSSGEAGGEGRLFPNTGAEVSSAGPLQRIVSLPKLHPGFPVGAVVYLHGHKNLKYVTTQYREIIAITVKSGWAFVSPTDGCPDQLLNVVSWVRSQVWSNQKIIGLGLKFFELLNYLKTTGQSPKLGPDYLLYFDDTIERGWHSTNQASDLNRCFVSVHDEILRTVEPQWGREHPFMEWLRSLDPRSHTITDRTSEPPPRVGGDIHEPSHPLSPIYTISGWMNSHVIEAVDLIGISMMTIIGPWKTISTKTLNAALRDWIAFTDQSASSSSRSSSRGGIYVIPTPSGRWHEGYYNLVAPIKLQRQTLGYASQGRATYRWKRIELPWGLVNGCVEMSLSSNLAQLRQEMQDSRSGWEGLIQLEGRVGVWGSPRLRMRVGSPSSSPLQLSRTPPSRAMEPPSMAPLETLKDPQLAAASRFMDRPTLASNPQLLPNAWKRSVNSINTGDRGTDQAILTPESNLKLPMPLDLQPTTSAPSTLQAETYCLCAQLYTSKGELVSYGYCNPKYPGLIDLQLRPLFLPPIIGATESSDHTSRTTHSNPGLRAQAGVSDPHLHRLHLFLTQSWLPTVGPGNNPIVMSLRDLILELPLVVKEDCKRSNILAPEVDLQILPSQHSSWTQEQRRFFDIKTYESRTPEAGNRGTLHASFGPNGDCELRILDRRNSDWLRSEVKISQGSLSIALVSSKSEDSSSKSPDADTPHGGSPSALKTETAPLPVLIDGSLSSRGPPRDTRSQDLPPFELPISNDSVRSTWGSPHLKRETVPGGPMIQGFTSSIASTDSLV